jgi:hypothetical protein
MHRSVEHACGVLSSLVLDIVSRLHEQNTQCQRKDGNGHQQDAEAELPGKRLAEMLDNVAHLSVLFLVRYLF